MAGTTANAVGLVGDCGGRNISDEEPWEAARIAVFQPVIPVKDLPHISVTRRGRRSPRGHVLEIPAFAVDAAGPGATWTLGAVGDAGTEGCWGGTWTYADT